MGLLVFQLVHVYPLVSNLDVLGVRRRCIHRGDQRARERAQ